MTRFKSVSHRPLERQKLQLQDEQDPRCHRRPCRGLSRHRGQGCQPQRGQACQPQRGTQAADPQRYSMPFMLINFCSSHISLLKFCIAYIEIQHIFTMIHRVEKIQLKSLNVEPFHIVTR